MVEDVASGNHHLQQQQPQAFDVSVEGYEHRDSKFFDEDGRHKRTGTVWTASAHIITAVIGAGVLSLSWAIAQLGWVAGPAAMILFSLVTYYTSTLLSVCYRTGDPVNGKRNHTYMDAVRSILGMLCHQIQFTKAIFLGLETGMGNWITRIVQLELKPKPKSS
ncbi:hypothetical protein Ahy_B10g103739 [Arachis hypogaea]|uniref:Amino acid transporter transmembrane domain-containing protein n=1 Tax=Arachis hypogaea TaxID=3818 RepID=A0A444X468_ARAHY|nr:hypothetical protein Ahy_B10g103739 [Arachis hypogaea]